MSLPLITDEVLNFSPCLVINQSFDHSAALKVAATLRSVASERLSVDINHIGTISKHAFVEQSTSYLHHPLVSRQRSEKFASEIASVIQALSLAS
jgi:hypothetical protein